MENVSTVSEVSSAKDTSKKSKSLWDHAWETLKKDKVAVISLTVVAIYALVAIFSALDLVAADWAKEVGASYEAPSWNHFFGTDIFGRSVLAKTIKGTQSAMSIGLFVATISVILGLTIGAIAGYYGGKVDEFIVWFYTVFSSIPYLMLLISITYILGKGRLAMYLALGLTSWVELCRLIRGEVIRHKNREYVQAASAIGASNFRKLFKHIVPNVFHLVIITFSLQFQNAIKVEVILSFIGLGSSDGIPSWGTMIDDAKLELARDVWWQLAGATIAMFFVVLALNLLGDALRDALDPKLKGKK